MAILFKKFRMKQIEAEPIYPQQWELADACNTTLAEGEKTPIVCLQTQAGKTGVMIALIYSFILWCKENHKTFQVVVICGQPHLDLIKQTRDRFNFLDEGDGKTVRGAGLDLLARNTRLARYPTPYQEAGILAFNNTKVLRKLNLNGAFRPDYRLIILDEVHLGNVRNGNIDTFLKNHGVYQAQQRHTWAKKGTQNQLVGVSATPFTQTLLSESYEGALSSNLLFKVHYRKPPPNYNSIEKMLQNGRLRDTQPLFIKEAPTKFLEDRYAEFLELCKRYSAGYMLIRATGNQNLLLQQWLGNRGQIRVETYDQSSQNLRELNNRLGQRPDKPVVIIIRGAMRAGMTLPAVNFIRIWVESPSTLVDAQTQSGVGRSCGYDRTEVYPIYATLKAMHAIVRFYNTLSTGVTVVPKGTQSHETGYKPGGPVPVYVATIEQARKLRGLMQGDGVKESKRWQITTTAGQKVERKALWLTQGRIDNSVRPSGYHVTLGTHVNGPGSSKNPGDQDDLDQKRDFDTLMAMKPGWYGFVIIPRRLVEHCPPEWLEGIQTDVLDVAPVYTPDSPDYFKDACAYKPHEVDLHLS